MSFKPGDIAILINASKHLEWIGREVELVSQFFSEKYQRMVWEIEIPGHPAHKYGGRAWVVYTEWLRKRPDPGRQKHLDGCKPYDKSYDDMMKELGHREPIKADLYNLTTSVSSGHAWRGWYISIDTGGGE
jgi:hypothetical protein